MTAEAAVAEALENNLSLLAERANIAIAEARLITAGLRPNPVLSGGGDHLDIIRPRFTEENGGGPTELNLRTDFLLERGGKRRLRTEVAAESRTAAELAFRNAVRTLALETQSAFVEALLARDSLALARDSLQSLNAIVEINQARLKAGDISRLELMRSELAALEFRNGVRQAELRFRLALNRLAMTLGREQGESLLEVEGDLRRDAAPASREELREQALRLRPDLLALRRDSLRAAAETRLQLAGARSDYTLGTEYRRQQGVNGKSNSVGFFFEVPLRFFERNQGEIERARQEQRQAELRVRAQERQLALEVDAAYAECETARALLADLEQTMLGRAREVREITEYSYKRGDATLLELLDAQRAFNETMQGYHDARAGFARSLYVLDSVSGKAVKP